MEQATVAAQGDARTGYFFEDLEIGMSADFRRVIGEDEMRLFADLTGDDNPLHFDDDFAEQSRFGGRIVHGMCTAALISTVIGTRMPGPGCIYLSQSLRFTAPVRPGDEVVARAGVDPLEHYRMFGEAEGRDPIGDDPYGVYTVFGNLNPHESMAWADG